jgi:flagellar protein FlbD
VILVHRLRGEPLFLNADLIECIEATPDTVVTLADGRKYVVGESPDEIVERARQFRASVLVAAEDLRRSSGGLAPVVTLPRRPPEVSASEPVGPTVDAVRPSEREERAHPGPAVP